MKKLSTKFYFLFAIYIVIIGCEKPKKTKHFESSYRDSIFEYRFNFPDTVLLNKSYSGNLYYKSVLDTITKSLDEKKNERILVFSFAKTSQIVSIEKLLKIAIDTIDAKNVHNIPLKNISFSQVGENYLDGIIGDYVIIDTNKIQNDNDDVRVIEKKFRATHKVFVIEK